MGLSGFCGMHRLCMTAANPLIHVELSYRMKLSETIMAMMMHYVILPSPTELLKHCYGVDIDF